MMNQIKFINIYYPARLTIPASPLERSLIYHVFIKLLLENFEGKRQKSGLFKVLLK
jgi:hypothetical protein